MLQYLYAVFSLEYLPCTHYRNHLLQSCSSSRSVQSPLATLAYQRSCSALFLSSSVLVGSHMAGIMRGNSDFELMRRSYCYSRWSLSVALIFRLKRMKEKTERINTNTTEQAMPAQIPAALLFVPAYIKMYIFKHVNCEELGSQD